MQRSACDTSQETSCSDCTNVIIIKKTKIANTKRHYTDAHTSLSSLFIIIKQSPLLVLVHGVEWRELEVHSFPPFPVIVFHRLLAHVLQNSGRARRRRCEHELSLIASSPPLGRVPPATTRQDFPRRARNACRCQRNARCGRVDGLDTRRYASAHGEGTRQSSHDVPAHAAHNFPEERGASRGADAHTVADFAAETQSVADNVDRRLADAARGRKETRGLDHLGRARSQRHGMWARTTS